MSRFVVTVIINKSGGRQQTPCDWKRSLVRPETLAGSYLPPDLPLSGNFSASDEYRPESGCRRAWIFFAVNRQVSIAALFRINSESQQVFRTSTDLIENCLCLCSLSSCEPQRNVVREDVQKAACLPHKYAIHGVTKLVIFSFKSSKFDSAGELTALPSSPSYEKERGRS